MLGTLAKAQTVLELYGPSCPEWGVTEVARTCGWPPSSTHLLMASLAEMGLLHRTVSGRYRLGFKLHKLSQILLSTTPWRDAVAQAVGRLSHETGETVYAAAMDGQHLVTVAAQLGARAGAIPPAKLNEEPPLHASAAGKVMLAYRVVYQPDILPKRLVALTPHTLTRRAELLAQLEQIRQTGLATNVEEVSEGRRALAAPIRNHNGEVIAALSLTAPAERLRQHQDAWASAVQQAAQQVSEQLGYWPETGVRLHWISSNGKESLRGEAEGTLSERGEKEK